MVDVAEDGFELFKLVLVVEVEAASRVVGSTATRLRFKEEDDPNILSP